MMYTEMKCGTKPPYIQETRKSKKKYQGKQFGGSYF